MHLIHPDSGAENGWARNIAATNAFIGPVWIGATDATVADNWVWTNNMQVPFALQQAAGPETLWQEGEPQDSVADSSNVQACANLVSVQPPPNVAGAWDDIACATQQGYICEKD
jgi:hypothetical protein